MSLSFSREYWCCLCVVIRSLLLLLLTLIEFGIPLHDRFVLARRQQLVSRLGHDEGVFKLRTPLSVRRDGRPVVPPRFVGGAPQIDHGFHRKDVSDFHDALGLVFGVVRHVGDGVEQAANAVTAVRPDDATLLRFGRLFNDRSQVSVQGAGFDLFERVCQTVKGGFHQSSSVVIHVADAKGFVQVAVVATGVVDGNVQIDDIPVLNLPIVGNAVADHFVHGRADGFGKVVVIQRRRVHVALQTGLVHDAVNLVRRDAHAHGPGALIQHLPSHATGVPQPRGVVRLLELAVLRVHANAVVRGAVPLFAFRHAAGVLGVVGLAQGGRHGTPRTVQGGSQAARELVAVLRPDRETQSNFCWFRRCAGHAVSGGCLSVGRCCCR